MTNHIHCIICGEPHEFEMHWEDNPHTYICNQCTHTFSAEYLAHRLYCWEHMIHKKEFDILEWRLTFGKNRPYPLEDNQEVVLCE